MAKKALITGITGQDGAYLAKFLLDKGYKVFGTFRRSSTPNFWRLQATEVFEKVTLIPADMADMASLLEAITVSDPDEIYNLAAQSYVGASFDQPLLTSEIDGSGTTRILEIIRHLKKDIKLYQASTSELFGTVQETPQTEKTPFMPNSPYAVAKLAAFHNMRIYREAYNIFACNGILFNHESPLRGLDFVTRKITNSVARIKLGLQNELVLGNTSAKRDWGYAPEYVEAMWMMLQQDKPNDLVCATGETHSVLEFVNEAFSHVNLNPEDYVRTDEMLIRPKDVNLLLGDPTKLKESLGWKPRVTFKELVGIMVKADVERWERCLKGEIFPWDAPSFPHNMDIVKRHKKS
ncbi:GDP-mannose 4,6-dehydratase [Candidatus Woesearchaeota archaeon]|jgi:GDPmannose 4,6-dehydratase|nr:GDP-mannose 4,6-dehydratase [Candidatus Woesearchaeota archaeon]MBT5273110.1 GDP-mannose 4,6-dehydratase [Candidatus Woesearchaeota archaeon]MBT6040788.1 GDP-mannose 4,6-dehydratase [Candidatus Woesearchaeota archaeon]MBT6337575.1 GDP-mannose 4,6-dehydratase [Candidatus Woesearchaeota archaeon]MBT7927024.1 GDP-mannose 4,6-dehydratase [Candidatus Woesearchaeota archaeon]